MFRFTQEQSSGSQRQCLAKITGMVPLCLSILFINNSNPLNMFRALISPIFRSARLCLQLVI